VRLPAVPRTSLFADPLRVARSAGSQRMLMSSEYKLLSPDSEMAEALI
jgi:hypothetical protein